MNYYPCLIVLTFVHCTHTLSFQFAATQSPNAQLHYYGDSTISAKCDTTTKCAIDTSSRTTCERWGCCFQSNNCYSTKYFIINQGPSKKKIPLFTVPRGSTGSPIYTSRAAALEYCQDNFPNGQLPVPTATTDWLTLAGRTEMFKGVFVGNAVAMGFHLHLDFDYTTNDVTTVDGEFVAKGNDFELHEFRWIDGFTSFRMTGTLGIGNGNPWYMVVLCQHD